MAKASGKLLFFGLPVVLSKANIRQLPKRFRSRITGYGERGMISTVNTTLSSMASGLKKVRWRGVYRFSACCPAHDDRNPSLSVSDSNGKILVKCWAGCSQEEVIGALRSMGLWHTASRHQLERRKRAELKEGIRHHQQILGLGMAQAKAGQEL